MEEEKKKVEKKQDESNGGLLVDALNEKNANLEKELAEKDKQLKQFQDYVLSAKMNVNSREKLESDDGNKNLTDKDIHDAYTKAESEMVKIVKNL